MIAVTKLHHIPTNVTGIDDCSYKTASYSYNWDWYWWLQLQNCIIFLQIWLVLMIAVTKLHHIPTIVTGIDDCSYKTASYSYNCDWYWWLQLQNCIIFLQIWLVLMIAVTKLHHISTIVTGIDDCSYKTASYSYNCDWYWWLQLQNCIIFLQIWLVLMIAVTKLHHIPTIVTGIDDCSYKTASYSYNYVPFKPFPTLPGEIFQNPRNGRQEWLFRPLVRH